MYEAQSEVWLLCGVLQVAVDVLELLQEKLDLDQGLEEEEEEERERRKRRRESLKESNESRTEEAGRQLAAWVPMVMHVYVYIYQHPCTCMCDCTLTMPSHSYLLVFELRWGLILCVRIILTPCRSGAGRLCIICSSKLRFSVSE